MGWAYLTQEEAQRTIEPNTLTVITEKYAMDDMKQSNIRRHM
jgi:hypothetical protein